MGVEGVEEGQGRAAVPACQEVERDGGEDGTDGVHESLKYDEEHGCGTRAVRLVENLDSVPISLEALGLVCVVKRVEEGGVSQKGRM